MVTPPAAHPGTSTATGHEKEEAPTRTAPATFRIERVQHVAKQEYAEVVHVDGKGAGGKGAAAIPVEVVKPPAAKGAVPYERV